MKPDITEPATTSMDVDYMAGEDDMTFFESEDDRWMMGDFDIDLDVDLGRPIDFEVDVTNHDDSGFQDGETSSGNVDPGKRTPPVSGSVSGLGRNESAGMNGLGSSTNRSGNSGGSNLVNSASAGIVNQNGNGNNDRGKKEVGFQPLPNVRFSGNGNDRGQPFNGSTGNGGGATPSNTTSNAQPPGAGNSRPSAGGFSFPSGVVRDISSVRTSLVRG